MALRRCGIRWASTGAGSFGVDEHALRRLLRTAPAEQRLFFLNAAQQALSARLPELVEANVADCEQLQQESKELTPLVQHKAELMYLPDERIQKIRQDLTDFVDTPDLVNSLEAEWLTDNKVEVYRRRKPRGRIGIVTGPDPADMAKGIGMSIFAGNAVTAKPSRCIARTAAVLFGCFRTACEQAELPAETIELLESREALLEAVGREGYLQATVVCGQRSTVRAVQQAADGLIFGRVPRVTCMFVHKSAEPVQVARILKNALLQEPHGECALDHLVFDQEFPLIGQTLAELDAAGVSIVVDERFASKFSRLMEGDMLWDVRPRSDAIFQGKAYGKQVAVRATTSVMDAVEMIDSVSSHHADVVLARLDSVVQTFRDNCLSSFVLHNTSPMLADSEGLGLGVGLGLHPGVGPLCTAAFMEDRLDISSIGRTRPERNLRANPQMTERSVFESARKRQQ